MTQTIEIEGKTYNVVVTDGKPGLVEVKQKLKPGTCRVGDVLNQLSVGDKIRIDTEVSLICNSNLPIQLLPTGFGSEYGAPWIDNDTIFTIPGESKSDETTVLQAKRNGLRIGDELWIRVKVTDMDNTCLPVFVESNEGQFENIWLGQDTIVKVVRK